MFFRYRLSLSWYVLDNYIKLYLHSPPNPVYIATQPDLVCIDLGILENNSILLRLDPQLDDLPIRFKEPDIFNEMVLLYLMRIVGSPDPDNHFIPLFFIERDMAGLLLGDCFWMGELLDVYRGLYEPFLVFSAVGTYPGFIQILESGQRRDILFSDERVVYVGTRGTGKFLHKIGRILKRLPCVKIDFFYFFL